MFDLSVFLESYWFYGLLAFVPIVLWLVAFKDNLPKQKSYLLLTFVAGMISVLPIKLYEKYWDSGVGYLTHTNLFRYLSDVLELGSLSAFLAYSLATLIVLFGIFVFVAIVMGTLEIFTGDNSVRVFKRKLGKVIEAPFVFVVVGVLCGLVAFGSSLSLHEKVWLFMLVGILEEFTKHLVLRFSDEEKIHSVGEAIQFSVVVALGLQEVLLHRHPVIEKLHQFLHLKGAVLFHEQKMMEGVILAMVLHGIYNSLLEFGYVAIALPMVGAMLLIVTFLLHQKSLLQQSGNLVKRRFENVVAPQV